MRFSFEAGSQFDVMDILDWYQSENESLALRFEAELDSTLHRIAGSPKSFSAIYKDVRRAQLKVFPYRVYFLAETDVIRIVCVIHTSRSPRVWKRRLRKI